MKKVTRFFLHTSFHRLPWGMGLLLPWFAFSLVTAQDVTIQGVVLDADNIPLAGVNVILTGTSYGTVTDHAGKFALPNIPEAPYELQISSVGYETYKQVIVPDTGFVSLTLWLYTATQAIDEVEVKSDQAQNLRKKESISIELIQEEFLKENRAGSLMETLNKIPGVQSMNIGTGFSKPMIRGLSYYRVVVAQNGIKTEGQQWSSHHGISVDQHAVNHVEMIKGPASLRYGSDAMGGVINILPDHVPLSGGASGEVSVSGRTNTGGIGLSGNLSARSGDVYVLATVSHNRFGDMHIPTADSFLLPAPVSAIEASHQLELGDRVHNTGGRENAVSFTTGMVKSWGNSYLELAYIRNETGFFDWEGLRFDSLRALHEKDRYDMLRPRQQISNFSVYHHTNRFFSGNKLEIAAGYQRNSSKEFDDLTDRTGNRQLDLLAYRSRDHLDLQLVLHTMTAQVVYNLNHIPGYEFTLGINNQYQLHTTDGYNHILPGYQRFSAGGFATGKFDIHDHWVLNSGLRVDYNHVELQEALNPDPAFGDSVFNPPVNKTFPALSFSAGINYLPATGTIYKFNIGKSYRVPSVYELAAYGLHRHEGRFEKGDIDNNPEQAWQLDLGVEKSWDGWRITASPFMNYFTNYLYLNPSPELRPEGQVYQYHQSRALLSGTEAAVQYRYRDRLRIETGAEYVYAVNLDLQRALPFTPPLSVVSQVNYTFRQQGVFTKNRMGLEMIVAGAQHYTVPNELSTPGYAVLGLNIGTTVKMGDQPVQIMVRVRNLLDTEYFDHVSFYRRLRIPEQGRDIQLLVSVPFEGSE